MKKFPLLYTLFFVFVFLLLGLSFLFPPKPKIPQSDNPCFSVRSSDKIFFKNVRSFYYNYEKDNAGVFMLRRFKNLESEPFQFLLIENEQLDEWYIRAYWADSVQNRIWSLNEKIISIDTLDNEEQWTFAFDFYSHLLNNQELHYKTTDKNAKWKILKEEQRKQYETTLFDYFRIIGLN